MARFRTSLEQVDAALELPLPQRAAVLAELAADLEDAYARLRADGLDPVSAERRTIELLLPDGAALRELSELHRPVFGRLVARLSGAGRARAERSAAWVLAAAVVTAALASLPLDALTNEPSPFLVPVLLLGCGGLAAAGVCALRLTLIGVGSADAGARGLDSVLMLAVAGPYLAFTGLAVDFYVAIGRIVQEPSTATSVLNALLRADGVLLVCALCLGLLTALSWLLLRGRVAALRDAGTVLHRGPEIALVTRQRDVA